MNGLRPQPGIRDVTDFKQEYFWNFRISWNLPLLIRDGGHEQLISNCERFKPAFAERDIKQTMIHKVRTYKEYHSVCPSSELGLSHPLSRQRVFPSPQKQGGGGTLACGWGVGGKSQFRRGAYTVVLFICTYFVQ